MSQGSDNDHCQFLNMGAEKVPVLNMTCMYCQAVTEPRLRERGHRHLKIGRVLRNFRTMCWNSTEQLIAVNPVIHNIFVIQMLLEGMMEAGAKNWKMQKLRFKN